MSYEEYLNQLHVDPHDEDSPLIKWFFIHEPIEEKQKIIALAGDNTYAYVSAPYTSGNISQPTHPSYGAFFRKRVTISLYQRGTGNKHVLQEDSQIYILWRQMIIDAAYIDSVGRGVTNLYSYEAIPQACKEPDISPDGKGIYAEVIHEFSYRIGAGN
jgi:hypothetical protein